MLKAKTHFFKNLDLSVVLDSSGTADRFTGTKLMATLGPSCHEVPVLVKMLEAGMVAARVDLTWGPLDFHKKSLANLQEAMKQTRRLCATVVDCLGRELMIKGQIKVNDQGYPWVVGRNEVSAGQTITITTRSDVEATNSVLPIMYEKFTEMAQKGDTIFLGRYLACGAEAASLYLEVVSVEGPDVICVAKNDAVLEGLLCVFHAERSADSVLNTQNSLPTLSDWDKTCLVALAEEMEIDYLAVAYTREPDDVVQVRGFLESVGMTSTKVLAKIETRQGLLNFQGILAQADGAIISRGNLGLDCMPEKMALIQKNLIQTCNLVGKPVLITRVVDTMVSTPRPTRAEATDVANAVLDGVDGILLGAETLRGQYPVECITTICSICRAAEAVFDHNQHYEYLMDVAQQIAESTMTGPDSDDDDDKPQVDPGSAALTRQRSIGAAARTMAKFSMGTSTANLTLLSQKAPRDNARNVSGYEQSPYLSKIETIASSAVRAAAKVAATLMIVYTHTGKTAELVAKYRPPMPILTLVIPTLISDNLKWRLTGRSSARQCLLSRGLLPILATPRPSNDALLGEAVRTAQRMRLVRLGDHVVVVQRVHDDFCIKIVLVDDVLSQP